MADLQVKNPEKPDDKPKAGLPDIWAPLENLRREVDRVFEDFGHGFPRLPSRSPFQTEPFWRRATTWPSVDIVEHATEFQVAVELPGMAEQDIEVKVVNDTLAIKGEKKEEKEENKKDYHLSERRYGAFQRTFRLPDDVDGDKIAASFKSGVLTVVLPKRAEAIHAERKIAVKAD